MGEPSRDRHSGVCRPLEWGDSRPGWVGEAGALLKHRNIVLASADAFQPQDSSTDQELSPVQDSLAGGQPIFHTTHCSLAGKSWKVHSNLTNAPAPNTVELLFAEGNWDLHFILRPTADRGAESTSRSDQFYNFRPFAKDLSQCLTVLRRRKMQRRCKRLAHICLHGSCFPFSPQLHGFYLWSHMATEPMRNWIFNNKQYREADQLKISLPVTSSILTEREEEMWEECDMKLLQLVLNCMSYPHNYRAQRKLSLSTAPLLQLCCWLKQLHRTGPIASLLTKTINLIFPTGECFKYHKSYSHYDLIHI